MYRFAKVSRVEKEEKKDVSNWSFPHKNLFPARSGHCLQLEGLRLRQTQSKSQNRLWSSDFLSTVGKWTMGQFHGEHRSVGPH
jgi:hypothetical protein